MTFLFKVFQRTAAAALIWAIFACGVEAAVDPVTVEIHYQSGIKYFKRGLYDKSIQEFEKTLSLDPANAEAKAYLEKVKEFQKKQKPAVPEESHDAEIRQLYEKGKELYRKGDYENARDVFNKILEIRRVDDFASYYREQCEVYIARKLERERKLEEKRRLKEKALEEKKKKKEDFTQKRAERGEMLTKRAEIKKEQRETQEKAQAPAQEKKSEKELAAEEKRKAAIEKREARLKELDEKNLAKAEAAARARQEKVAAREAKKFENKMTKQGELESREARQRHKELFIKGVEQYSRKEYAAAIASFNELIEAEKKSGMVYSRTAERLRNKAVLRQKGVGEDREI